MYSVFGPSVPHSWYTYVCQALCVIDLVDALQQCCSSTPQEVHAAVFPGRFRSLPSVVLLFIYIVFSR